MNITLPKETEHSEINNEFYEDQSGVYFYDGVYSNWYLGAPFKLDGISYNCSE